MYSQLGNATPKFSKRQVHLLVNYFNPPDEDRQIEINKCLRANVRLKTFHRIHVLVGPGTALPDWIENPRIRVTQIDTDRVTYQGFFDYANEKLPKRAIAVIINADIACTPSINYLRRYVTNTQCVALRRWEYVKKEWTLIPINSSQDLWALEVPIAKLDEPADFELGVPGCDNLIAFMLDKHYTIKNPAKTVITYHIHKSGERSYGPRLKGRIKRVNIE